MIKKHVDDVGFNTCTLCCSIFWQLGILGKELFKLKKNCLIFKVQKMIFKAYFQHKVFF
jgi:hypothetical protein